VSQDNLQPGAQEHETESRISSEGSPFAAESEFSAIEGEENEGEENEGEENEGEENEGEENEGEENEGEENEGEENTVAAEPGDALQVQLQEANDRLLRSQAELDNFRKRSRRELDEQLKYAQLPIMRDLLPVLDNLERAVSATQLTEDPAAESLLQGVQLVMADLKSILQRHHCRQIESVEGTEFDPNCHEAIAQQPSAEHPPGTVIQVAQTGYQLHDRVVRPSQVVVTTASVGKDDSEASSGGTLEG